MNNINWFLTITWICGVSWNKKKKLIYWTWTIFTLVLSCNHLVRCIIYILFYTVTWIFCSVSLINITGTIKLFTFTDPNHDGEPYKIWPGRGTYDLIYDPNLTYVSQKFVELLAYTHSVWQKIKKLNITTNFPKFFMSLWYILIQ